jgi:hypothetical protein
MNILIKKQVAQTGTLWAMILILLLPVKNSKGQTADLGSWNIVNIKYNQNEKLSLFGEGQLRSLKFYNHFHYYEFKGGFNYKIHKGVSFSLGAGSYQTYKEGGNFKRPKNNDEFRLWPQLLLLQEVKSFKIEQRYRAEMRWTSSGYRNRFRYRVGISYPFGKNTKGYQPFKASISNELFFTDREPYFERNRLQMTVNYKTSRNATLQVGYLHQFDYKINDETGRDFLVVGFYYELFRKKKAATGVDNELINN